MNDRWIFKAKKESDDEWTQGFLSRIGETNSYQINGILVKTNTICQCSGLKDCEGSLIFEGDIIRILDEPEDETVIRRGCGQFILDDSMEIVGDLDLRFVDIVGNIHDEEA